MILFLFQSILIERLKTTPGSIAMESKGDILVVMLK